MRCFGLWKVSFFSVGTQNNACVDIIYKLREKTNSVNHINTFLFFFSYITIPVTSIRPTHI